MPTLTICPANSPVRQSHRAADMSEQLKSSPLAQQVVSTKGEHSPPKCASRPNVSQWLHRLEHLMIRPSLVLDAQKKIESGNYGTKLVLDAAIGNMIDDVELVSLALSAPAPTLPPSFNRTDK